MFSFSKSILFSLLMIVIYTDYTISWNMYTKNDQFIVLSYPPTQQYIVFNVNPKQLLITYNDGQNIKFEFIQSQIKAEMKSFGQNIQLEVTGNLKQHLHTNSNIKQLKTNCKTTKQQKQSNFQVFKNVQEKNQNNLYECIQSSISFSRINNQFKFQNWTIIQYKFYEKIINFTILHKIPEAPSNIQILNFAVKQLFSSIHFEQNQQENYYCFGDRQCDDRLGLLPLQIIREFDKEFGYWMAENYINYFQTKLYYESHDFITLPENIQVFMRLYPNAQVNPKIAAKLEKVFLGFINEILLYPVNHIEQQLNYRAQNKLHPTLNKMLTLPFFTDSISMKSASIYTESFLEDLYYHSEQKELEMAIGKYMFLVKALVFTQFYSINYGFQSNGLRQIITNLVNEDNNAKKTGHYRSIVREGRSRTYSSDITYESLLPYTYSFSTQFPKQLYLNLTTPYGLASMPLSSSHLNTQQYRYRGNIHSYYNFKFLRERKYPQQVTLWENLQKKVVKDWSQHHDIFTAWDSNGLTKQKLPWLKIISATFLASEHTQKKQTSES